MSAIGGTKSDETCPICHGTGVYEFIDPDCPQCKGGGMVEGAACRCERVVPCQHFRKWDKQDKYAAQSDLLRQVFATPTHSMDELLRLMRHTGQTAVYLSGTRLDNDQCFGSDALGLLISVLPQDAEKAAEPGYHPGSTEVYVTFQGSLVMEFLEDGRVKEKIVGDDGDGKLVVLPAGQCHRVRFDTQREASSVIVKTDLRAKPGVVRCADCAYYPDARVCPLSQRWSAEKQLR